MGFPSFLTKILNGIDFIDHLMLTRADEQKNGQTDDGAGIAICHRYFVEATQKQPAT
jgi:hypothetical protein